MLYCKDAWYFCNGFPVLSGVSVTIKPGAVTAIIGKSGSGKSTLIKMLSFLKIPNEEMRGERGVMAIDQSAAQINQPQKWEVVSALLGNSPFKKYLTIRKNIMINIFFRQSILSNIIRKKVIFGRLAKLSNDFCLGDSMNKFPHEVSPGQRLLAEIIMVCTIPPKYLLIDEFSTRLCHSDQAPILETIKKLKAKNTGVAFVTHDLNSAAEIADEIVFMDRGKVEEVGEIEILTKPKSDSLNRFVSRCAEADRDFYSSWKRM